MASELNWKRVLFIDTHPAACLARSLLLEAGFHPAPVSEAEAVYLAGADLMYYVEVPAAELEEARHFLSGRGYTKNLLSSGA